MMKQRCKCFVNFLGLCLISCPFLDRRPRVQLYCLPCGVVVLLPIVVRSFGWEKKAVSVVMCEMGLIFVMFHFIRD